MKNHLTRLVFGLVLLTLILLASNQPLPTQAQRPLPPNNAERGLVYDGLQPDTTGKCAGGLTFSVTSKGKTQTYCTHGPDEAPLNANVASRVPPARSRKTLSAQSLASVVCDGDGVTGNRVQVIYAHASDVPDQYGTYFASFQQWASDMDNIFNNSAAVTGGTRHVRFVTDSSCAPVIPDVTLSTTGDDTFVNTIIELQGMGYDLPNRKYVVFVDSHVYCGISSTAADSSPGSSNANNYGNTFGRIDAGCWTGWIPAHELEHQLGAVQMNAPHSDGNWHCSDGLDLMCDYGNSPNLNINICPNSPSGYLFDCNNDDYFSTNPPANSYLATHWNTANSVFLIGQGTTPTSALTARVDSIASGKMKGKIFNASNSFKAGDTVVMRIHVVNQDNASLSGALVTMPVVRPDGKTQCTFAATTDSTGTAQGNCNLPKNAPKGIWQANLTKLSASGYSTDSADSVLADTFQVQ